MWWPFLSHQHHHAAPPHHSHNGHHHITASRKQQLQLLVIGLCLVCILPTRLFLKSQKWRFSSLGEALPSRPSFNSKLKIPNTRNNKINSTAECRSFPEGLFQLTNSMHENPEQWALRPWRLVHAGPKYPAWHFPGLSSQLLEATVLRGHRVALVGDSTLLYLQRWMQTLILNQTQAQCDALIDLDLTEANYAVNPDMDWQVGWADATAPNIGPLEDGTHMVWHGHRGAITDNNDNNHNNHNEACHFDSLWTSVQKMQPNILVVNFGLHWLHIQGHGRNVPICYVHAWLNYEDWLQQVVQVAQQANVRLLLFKTTNKICTDHFRGDCADGVALYQRPDTRDDTLQRCQRLIRDMIPSYSEVPRISHKNITRYCQKAVMDEFGVKDLNHRLLEFVHKRQQQQQRHQNQKNNLTMAVYNDHDIQSCAYSSPEDGRHYHPLNLMRIRLLGNMIQCLYPHDDDDDNDDKDKHQHN